MAKRKDEVIQSQMIKLDQIREPKFIARLDFDKDEMQELMDSITAHGLIQPIRVKGVKGGYEIVAGHRRYLAHKKLKLKEIRAEIVQADDTEHEIVKMHENKRRKDLSDIEEAKSFEHLKKITGLTNKAIAKHANVSESYVTQKLAIMGYPTCVFNALETGQLTFSCARELVRISDFKVLEDYVDHACRSGITPRVAKQWADDWLYMNKHGQQEEKEEVAKGEGRTMDTIKLPCFCCGHYYLPENTSMIRVSKDHLEIIKEALKKADG